MKNASVIVLLSLLALVPFNSTGGQTVSTSREAKALVQPSSEATSKVPSGEVGKDQRKPSVSPSELVPRPEGSDSGSRTTDTPSKSGAESPTTIYRIGVGDVLDIRLINSSVARSTLFTVIDGGIIDFPIAGGAVAVGGLTVEEAQARIAAELKRRAVEEGAQVSVGVRQYASHSVVVTGLVNNPGARILRREAVPLYVIMADAQLRPDAGRVAIMRDGVVGQFLDLSDPATLNTTVQSGDVISVSARPQEFYYIGGRVNYPGQKVFQPGISLLQSILAAGGLTRPNDNRVELSREGDKQLLTTTRFSLKDIKSGKIPDPRLQPGDRIEVKH